MAIRMLALPARRGDRSGRHLFPLAAVALTCVAFACRRAEAPLAAAPQIVGEFDTVSLPVPAASVPAGTPASEIKLKRVSFPKHQLPDGALTDLGELAGTFAVVPLPANLPLFRENFDRGAAATNPVAERIPRGMRAMTIGAESVSGFEEWTGSGAVVDVLLVESGRTTVVAEQVTILSAEHAAAGSRGALAAASPRSLTLLVTQDQCLAINTAIPLGRLSFAVRSAGDREGWRTQRYSSERLRDDGRAPAKKAAVAGAVSFSSGDERKRFALVDGKWIPADVTPDGFLISEER